MSSTTNIGGGNVVQSLAQKVLTTFDADGDSRLSSEEFQNFLQKLVATLSGTTLPTTNAATSSTTKAAPSASARAAAAAAAVAGQYEFRAASANTPYAVSIASLKGVPVGHTLDVSSGTSVEVTLSLVGGEAIWSSGATRCRPATSGMSG